MAVGVSDRGSIRSGLGEWVVQRLTAVYLLVYIIIALIYFTIWPISSYTDWVQLSSNLFYQISTLLFIFSLLAHAWLGLKSVFLDYIKPWRLRFLLQMVLATVLLGIGVWALLVIGVK